MTDTTETKDETPMKDEVIFKLTPPDGCPPYYLFRMLGDKVDLRRQDDHPVQLSLFSDQAAALRLALCASTCVDDVRQACALYLRGWYVEPFNPSLGR